MSNYFLSAAQTIERLPKFLSHLARPIAVDLDEIAVKHAQLLSGRVRCAM
jgi:hypothetical protein